ncbi:MAG: ATP-binding protein [Candidatus Kapaibacterium sp.]|jgi:hypothetical protein
MTTEALRQFLEGRSETTHIDVKAAFAWNGSNKKERLGITKDILAFANKQDGGSIIIGIDDTLGIEGLSPDQLSTFDVTKVNDFIHKYTDPTHSVSVSRLNYEGKELVVIEIPEFTLEPIICKVNGNDSEGNQLLQEGALYIRTEGVKSESIKKAQDMRGLLRRASAKDGSSLLRDIERLLQGKPKDIERDSIAMYQIEIENGSKFISKTIGAQLRDKGSWEVLAYPIEYADGRFDLLELRPTIEEASVSLRGWPFPYTDREHSRAFQDAHEGFESVTIWVYATEAWRLYKSGLFFFEGVLTEDLAGPNFPPNVAIDIEVCIYRVTECVLFLSRLAQSMNTITDYALRIKLKNVGGRQLMPFFTPRNFAPSPKLAQPELFAKRIVSSVELTTHPLDVALVMIRDLFFFFHGRLAITDSAIKSIQQRLVERRV